jgi:hypothetical protein
MIRATLHIGNYILVAKLGHEINTRHVMIFIQHLLWSILDDEKLQEKRLFLLILDSVRFTVVVLFDKTNNLILFNTLTNI